MRAFLQRSRQRLIRLIFTPQHPRRRLMTGIIVGTAVGCIIAPMLWRSLFSSIRTRLTDMLYQPRPTTGIVSIIAIDDASLGAYGRSPVEWPRSIHTELVQLLNDAGAKVIAFDVLFAEPTPDDADLSAAMLTAKNVIQPAVGSNEDAMPTTQRGDFIRYSTYEYPTPELAAAAQQMGHVNVVPDSDGQIRRVPLFIRDGDQLVPAFALAAYTRYLRFPFELVEVDSESVKFANRKLYTNDTGQMLIYYFGPPTNVNQPGTFPVYSLVDVLEGHVAPEVFADQIVVIGVLDAAAQPDNYATPSVPTGKKMYGVEIHANIIETIHQALPTVPGVPNKVKWAVDLGFTEITFYRGTTTLPLRVQPFNEKLLVIFLLAIGMGIALSFLRWYVGLLLTILVYGLYFFWASTSFTVWGRILELLFPALTLALIYLEMVIASYIFEERRRSQINDLFIRYVSAEIAQKIVEAFDRGQLELGGEEREITVLFADIRGFTTLSEGMTPAEVVRMLNIFLNEMTAIVMHHGGAINKYIGDNLMAFWNAPYPQEEHAWQATQAGLEILEVVHRLNSSGNFSSPVQFGIGVNTGPVVVGNIGSERRLEYTPIGNTVNVASRLCGVAPGGTCYIGDRTRELLGDRVQPVEVHHLQLKGKQEPVEIYELHPRTSDAPPRPK